MNTKSSTLIIAEAGVNHNGSLDLAKQLIDVAVEAKADAVKFQTFKPELGISQNAPKAVYQKETTDTSESQLDMAKKLELDESAFKVLAEYCNKKSIEFISTPFDLYSLNFLVEEIGVGRIKIPSGEVVNGPFLLKAAQSGKPIILSTGMGTLGEVETALGVLAFGYVYPQEVPSIDAFQAAYASREGQNALQEKVMLQHCTTAYPTPFSDANLRAIDTLKNAFGLQVGFSDHTLGITLPIAAVAREADAIEKHFTLDRNLPGPDHRASLEPDELKTMVNSIREVEEALGSGIKTPMPSEIDNKAIARKSLVAAEKIAKGTPFSIQNLTFKRPGTGISPMYYWDFLGKVSERDYEEDELIDAVK